MKYKELFAKEIVEIAVNGDGIAFNKYTGKVMKCSTLGCNKCGFYKRDTPCEKMCKRWAESEVEK